MSLSIEKANVTPPPSPSLSVWTGLAEERSTQNSRHSRLMCPNFSGARLLGDLGGSPPTQPLAFSWVFAVPQK